VDITPIAESFRREIRERFVSKQEKKPRLVAFLCSKDPSAETYATFTQNACKRDGIEFELRKIPRTDLEDALIETNQDPSVHGILVYYPVFGMMDNYLQEVVATEKDIEGMSTKFRFNLYHNIRYFDEEKTKKCILPCTALAIVKIIDGIGEYDHNAPVGEQLAGKIVTVINRSEIVGRPLAALLANDGAFVYSVDVNGCIIFQKGKVPGTIKMVESELTTEEAIKKANILVTGVPSPNYKIPLEWVQEGSSVINFASFGNIDEAVAEKALYVPSIGKVTIAMLERNLVRLYDNFHQ